MPVTPQAVLDSIVARQQKQTRKIRRYLDTPEAKMNRAGAECFADEWGIQMIQPESTDDLTVAGAISTVDQSSLH